MRRFAEFVRLLWKCKFCGYGNVVLLRERTEGAFPTEEEYDNFKPFACFHCGSHQHFELHSAKQISRVVEANGER
jgi:hypothetical protein